MQRSRSRGGVGPPFESQVGLGACESLRISADLVSTRVGGLWARTPLVNPSLPGVAGRR